ncbi:MAG: PQQ-like beta-propeller repeat protein [Planctomycetales bacterium]|nr:PQQ-like beta-propeller repeat protein [Planctomycetales bacterium]
MRYQSIPWTSAALGAWLLLGLATSLLAEDWPQWMGPGRDNVWSAKGVLKKFPAAGLKVVWRAPVANGYAGPAVVGEFAYVTDFETEVDVKVSNFDRREMPGSERVHCLDAGTGQPLWSAEHAVTYAISYPSGPRCTPLVDGDRLYTLGAEGHLQCFERRTGDILWARELKQEYGTNSALWGYASHPLIDGNKLLCLAGGQGTHAVALDKLTGQELWRYGTASEQGYAPPKIIEAGGVRQLILTSPDYVAAVDPESGKEYWKEEYGASSGSIIMTPVHAGNYLFVGGYSHRNLMLELDADRAAARPLFRDRPKLGVSPVNVQPFLQDDNLMIGIDQGGELMAVDIPSGERLWSTGQPLGKRPVGNGTAFIVKNGSRFLLFTEAGELVMANITREGYQELDRTQVIQPTNNAFGRPVVWSAPAFAQGRMFVRNDEELLCIELSDR